MNSLMGNKFIKEDMEKSPKQDVNLRPEKLRREAIVFSWKIGSESELEENENVFKQRQETTVIRSRRQG